MINTLNPAMIANAAKGARRTYQGADVGTLPLNNAMASAQPITNVMPHARGAGTRSKEPKMRETMPATLVSFLQLGEMRKRFLVFARVLG